MWLSNLLNQLTPLSPKYAQRQIDQIDIFSFQCLSDSFGFDDGSGAEYISFHQGVLYVGTTDRAVRLKSEGRLPHDAPLLLVQSSAPVDSGESPEARNLALLAPQTSMDSIITALHNVFAQENRRQNGMRDLLAAHNQNKGLQNMVDEAARILANPVIVVDVSFKLLAICQRNFVSRPDIEAQRELGYILSENVDDLRNDHIYEKLRETRYPHYSKQERHHTSWINTLVFMHGMEVAQIGVLEQDTKITDVDLELVNFLSYLISLELQKSDFFKANRGIMHSFFLSELLDGSISDVSVVELRLKHLNWSPTPHMYIMVLTDKTPGFFDGKARIIPQHIQKIFPTSRWAIFEQSIVILLNMANESTSFMDDKSPLHEYLSVNNLTAMISSRFSDLLCVQAHYHQAMKAYDLGRRLFSDRFIYYYPDYIFHHIGSIVAEHHDLKDFLHPAVLKIIHYDDTHKTNLLETLEQHLMHTDNPTYVAKTLFIHRNTLFYRLSKIKDSFNIDLADGDERLKIQLSLKFLHLIKN